MDTPQAETWEQRQANENTKAKELKKKLRAVCKELGAELVKEKESDYSGYARETFIIEGGEFPLQIHGGTSHYEKWRFTFRPWFPGPQDCNPCASYKEKYPEITVSSDKTPQQIARDINLRLLPESRRLYAVCLDNIKKKEDYAARQAAAVLRLDPKADKGAQESGAFSFHQYENESLNFYGDVKTYGETVNMSLRSLPLNIAVEVLDLLRSRGAV